MTVPDEGVHQCPARRCPRTVPDHLLMCPLHWRLVPKPVQRAVNAAYDHRRGLGTPALRAAQLAAIRAVDIRLNQEQP
jgi:hypothetical protein